MILSDEVFKLISRQKTGWKTAAENYNNLKHILIKNRTAGSIKIQMQYNPLRITSSSSSIDRESVQKRACFLCTENRPIEQTGVPYKDKYLILINPFPIFTSHLTIPAIEHTDQRIGNRLEDMLDLSHDLPDFVLFYNGPQCGASAPDHFHFQAGNRGVMPIEKQWNDLLRERSIPLIKQTRFGLYRLTGYPQEVWVMESDEKKQILSLFGKIYNLLAEKQPSLAEPMMNLLCRSDKEGWKLFIFPRRLHRPKQYYFEEEQKRLISPGAVDVAGLLITSRKTDFENLSSAEICDILQQVSLDSITADEICHLMTI